MSISKLLFGEIALKKQLVNREQVDECLDIQKKLKDMGISRTLGAVMHDKKYLTMVEIKEILREMTGTKDWNAIEGYEILGKLGKGGMGAVYKARHQKLNKIVALKVLPPELASDQEYLDRFQREARAAAKLNHVNIVQALDVGESYGYHYFVMEYADGKTVKDLIEDKGTVDEADAIDIVEQIASALAHAAKNDLVHRDIKPSNIIVTPEGVAKLLDLGLAKSISEDQAITQTGVIMGTPFYLSPEQARSEDLDPRSDIYSLGVTLFHMLTGQVPFNGNSAATILYKHIFQEPPKAKSLNPRVSAPVSEFVVRLMAKSKDDRPATCEAMIEEIEVLREKAQIKRPTKAPSVTGVRGSSGSGSSGVMSIPSPLPGSTAPPRGIDGPSLDTMSESAAATGATPSTSQAMTAAADAVSLEVSGPQAAATHEGRTEAIGASAKKDAKKDSDEKAPRTLADLKSPDLPRAKGSRSRALAMAGAAAYIALASFIAWRGITAEPPGGVEIVGSDPVALMVATEEVGRPVKEGLARVEALRAEKKFKEAADALIALTHPPGSGKKAPTVAEEVAIRRVRAAIVSELMLTADSINQAYDKAAKAGQDTEAFVKQAKALDVHAAERILGEERAQVEAERKALGGAGAGSGASGGGG